MTELFQLIEKEDVNALRFPKNDVLENDDLINDRDTRLKRALSLGNMEHIKAKIYFEDDQCKKKVETTIWGVTDKRIILKKGVVIPISRIHKIRVDE